jgi:hypothetical protein
MKSRRHLSELEQVGKGLPLVSVLAIKRRLFFEKELELMEAECGMFVTGKSNVLPLRSMLISQCLCEDP